MRKTYGIVVVLFVALGASVLAIKFNGYRQVECDIDPAHGATIWMDEKWAVKRDVRFNIDIQNAGIVMRFPPAYYGLDWEDIGAIVFRYSNNINPYGALSLRIKRSTGTTRVVEVGEVERDCWASIKDYLRSQIEARGRAVNVEEIIQNQ